MIKTKYAGVYFREIKSSKDKTYYITYKDIETNKKIWIKIGKYSEGIREVFCHQTRNQIITKTRLGEELNIKPVKKRSQTKVLFEDLANVYFRSREDGKSKKKDESINNKHLIPYFNQYNMESLVEADIEDFVIEKMEDDNITSPKTVSNMLTLLSAIVNYSIRKELLKNIKIIDFIKEYKPKQKDSARERFLSIDECKKLYKRLEEESEEQLLLFTKLALTTGARLSTLLAIQKKDIDFNHGILTLKDFKNDSTYKGFLIDDLKETLFEYTKSLNPTDRLFNCVDTTIQKPLRQYLNELFNEGLEKKDAKNRVVIHTLRHTFASLLAINGTPIFTIQKLMNHKDIKMTMRYAKLAPDSGKNAVENIGF